MTEFDLYTDFNGIVFFNYKKLRELYGGSIFEGQDLFNDFISTDIGDDVLKKGIVIPILSIDDGGYEIIVRLDDDASNVASESIICTNTIFPLEVTSSLTACDLACLKDWEENTGWVDTLVPTGFYAVTVNGFQEKDFKGTINKAGYELVLKRCDELPGLSADVSKNMRVLI